ncbi:hypothetical protein OE88DRAFT_1666697 [Heliocybe sulcata]|uniref:Uncharacterized protein n=1 Tax=Heliocybe sulcata TaxID=5364 RepID=A0A5C3MRB1_9AGAM|nr:hypothetical protein OE88DRAFT_1666697 [Heliocybe sulcata]
MKLNLSQQLTDTRLAHLLSGDTCTPIGLPDFEAYLSYVEFSLENLHFVVWYQDYRARFFSLPLSEQSQSPGSQAAHFPFSQPSLARTERTLAQSERRATVSSARSTLTYTSVSEMQMVKPALSLEGLAPPQRSASRCSFAVPLSTSPLLWSAGESGRPITIHPESQPFREEIAKVVATFFRPSSEQELSLDSRVRDATLSDLTWNTHPDVLLPIYEEVYNSLETVSLPRFLAYASTNINLPLQLFWYIIGILDILLGLAIAIALIVTLPVPSQANRAWRLFSLPIAAIGAMQVYAAWRGYDPFPARISRTVPYSTHRFCSRVWRRGGMQVRPWELSSPPSDSESAAQQEKAVIAPFAAREKEDKWRVPVFGPERVVLDPRIAQVHKKVMRDIWVFGAWFSLVSVLSCQCGG